MPPVARTAPRLLAKQSRQLVVSPLVSFSGDGPIASVRLHYRPQDSTMDWSAIVGEWEESWGGRGLGRTGVLVIGGKKGRMEREGEWRKEKRGLRGEWQV